MSEEIIREYTNAKLALEGLQMRNISGLTPDERFDLDKESAVINSRYFKAWSNYQKMLNDSIPNNDTCD